MNGSTEPNSNSSPNPVVIGNKMVERVVHMRRLAPPKQETGSNAVLTGNRPALSPDGSSGFGRNLSKKSLDMALRHMVFVSSLDFFPCIAPLHPYPLDLSYFTYVEISSAWIILSITRIFFYNFLFTSGLKGY